MDLVERAMYLTVGGGVGFVLGYIVARLREIKEELDEVAGNQNHPNEGGFMRLSLIQWMAIICVAIVAASAFASAKATSKARETAARLETVVQCNTDYFVVFLNAVEPRTDAVQDSASDNVELQRAWFEFVRFSLQNPPAPKDEQRRKANEYFTALKEYVKTSSKAKVRVDENPYPTADQLILCINKEENTK